MVFRHGRSTDLVKAMGMEGISKRNSSPLQQIDQRVDAFLDRPLDGDWPYVWLDATNLKVRDDGGIVSVAAIIAMEVSTDGRRERRSGNRRFRSCHLFRLGSSRVASKSAGSKGVKLVRFGCARGV